ncbi:FAS1 domain-containing protein SELMODRAFT_448915-like [Benincasa hispida]|uniref:FAS1 domain-containing protein SELMODRAFT_448915-like n=1 Tax=Benincasa hispida TaxID=102211 RepID=UPI0018FFC7B8|nr:FAS1 domain-containing protein SELMODRAFT_448915-like [Benincasa hispida]
MGKINTIIFVLVSLLFLISISSAVPIVSSQPANHTDLQAAIEDMKAKSFYGFAILLQMLNITTQLTLKEITFFIPQDPQLSNISIAVDRLEAFVLSHLIVMPLEFSDLIRFPTGSIVPSGYHNRMIRIHNHGRGHFVVNNAVVNVPNVCSSSESIKCHGVNKVIDYGRDSYGNLNN